MIQQILLFTARCHICAVYFPTIWPSTVHVKILSHICVLNNKHIWSFLPMYMSEYCTSTPWFCN